MSGGLRRLRAPVGCGRGAGGAGRRHHPPPPPPPPPPSDGPSSDDPAIGQLDHAGQQRGQHARRTQIDQEVHQRHTRNLPAIARRYARPMRAVRTITVVGCHAGGEIGNVVVGGVLPPPGATVFDQMRHLQQHGDGLRKLLLREPRGSVACHANLVVPATQPGCDAGFIIMEPTEYPPMSGSNTICTATVLLEIGAVADARARDGAAAGGAGRRDRGARRLQGRPLRERRVQQRARASPTAWMRRWRWMGWARSPSTSPTAACGT